MVNLERVRNLFREALLRDADNREAYLEAACGGDSELRKKVELLLTQATGAMEQAPTIATATTRVQNIPSAAAEAPGMNIGPYRLLEMIGEGGFGTVWTAQQQEPVTRRVALKIIKLGMDTREVIARFQAESQALAMLDHPNIARVFDAGSTETGRPYFVMELVKGVPILEYCDSARLDTRARLELFIRVCRAIQHAHQKGIIHRDIKPGNVLATLQDGKPSPKVIDFGIAKAMGSELSRTTVFTQHHVMIGTPAYMSPEQAEMAGLDIDTRTDIYSLGVLLYELLTGTTPFNAEDLMKQGIAEMVRALREEEPPRPSTRISTLGETAPLCAGQRDTDVRELASALRGDLDWIVMKCLEKDRTRRYETVNALAEDVRRHLHHEPVLAGPPSAAYRLNKFARRNRTAVAAGLLVLTALVVGAAGATWGLIQSRREQARTAEALAELEQVTAFQAQQLSNLDSHLMGSHIHRAILERKSTALAGRGEGEKAAAAAVHELERALSEVNFTDVALSTLDVGFFEQSTAAVHREFVDRPLIKARLLQTIADTLRDLGLLERAAAPQAEALAIRRTALGSNHPSTLSSLNSMGLLQQAQGRLTDAEPLFREALAGSRKALGGEHPHTLTIAANLGGLLLAQGRWAEAEPIYIESLEIRRRTLGDDHIDTLAIINNMGHLLHEQGRLDEAEPYYREVEAKCRVLLGDDHPATLTAISNLAMLLDDSGRHREAERLLRDVLAKRRHVLGDDHPATLASIINLAAQLRDRGRLADAEPLAREGLESSRRVLGGDHPYTLTAVKGMGRLLAAKGAAAAAEMLLARHETNIRLAFTGENAPRLAAFLTLLGQSQVHQGGPGKLAAAEEILLEAHEILSTAKGEDHRDTRESVEALVSMYEAWHEMAPGAGHDAAAARWRARLDIAN